MKDQAKKYDTGDVVDILADHVERIENIDYMVDELYSQIHAMRKLGVNELIINSTLKSHRVLDTLVKLYLTDSHSDLVKYQTEWDNEK